MDSIAALFLSDAEAAAKWLSVRNNDTSGKGWYHRGWFHDLYRDLVRAKMLLDVGCGFGISSISFLEMGARVTFIDIVESNIKLVEKVVRHLRMSHSASYLLIADSSDLKSLPTDYDVITALGSLHHAPSEFNKPAIDELLRHLKIGGRWLQLAYPFARWEREGVQPYHESGKMTDGEGTPWAEPYDLPKLLKLMAPAELLPILYQEFHNADFNWFDLKLVTRG